MKLSHELLVKILKSVPATDVGGAGMHLVVKRPYGHLLKELQGVFGEQRDVQITLDNRYEERRTESQPIADERRQRERRTEKDTLLEVILAA